MDDYKMFAKIIAGSEENNITPEQIDNMMDIMKMKKN